MQKIKRLASEGKYFITRHAVKRLKERGFEQKDVEFTLKNGVAIIDSSNESKYRVVAKISKKSITLSVKVRDVLIVKSVWESKKWERKVYEEKKMV